MRTRRPWPGRHRRGRSNGRTRSGARELTPEEELRPEASPEGESQPEATPEETGPDAGQEEAGSRQKEPRNSGRELYQSLRTLVMVLGVLILMFTFVMRIIVVSGPSMENTLQNGDAMLVWSLGYTPDRETWWCSPSAPTRRTPSSSG